MTKKEKKDINVMPVEDVAVKEDAAVEVSGDVETTEPTVTKTPTQIGVVCNCEKLNLRREPAILSKVLKVLNKGTEVEIIKPAKGFYAVKVGDISGYCMKKYITIK